jgi:hypothetical protein
MRTLHPANPMLKGKDVEHLQQLLKIPADGIYGTQTATAVYRAKAFHFGYRTPDHSAGDRFLAYLEGTAKPTAAMLSRAKERRKAATGPGSSTGEPKTATASRESVIRASAISLMNLLMHYATRVHYPPGDVRRQSIHSFTTRAQIAAAINSKSGLIIDCSQYSALIARVCGGKVSWSYDPYTGTFLEQWRRITKTQARPGDVRVYGPGTGHHMAVVFEPGSDPLMSSQGKESPDPHLIRDSIEQRYQPSGGAWLRLPI